jgi:hypothetical protein
VTNIMTAAEAANALRCGVTDPAMLDLLPQVDGYINYATGHDWTADAAINPVAKAAARMLLVKWHEDPGMNATQAASLAYGLSACLVQLEAMNCQNKEFMGLNGSGYICLPGAAVGDTVVSVLGLVGLSGDQAASFESVISVQDYIMQVSSADLYLKWFRVNLRSVGAP